MMPPGTTFQNRGQREGNQIVWLLFNHRIEFGEEELRAIVADIKGTGLFRHLQRERPALLSQMHAILSSDLPDGGFESSEEEEFFLEQCLLGLADRVF